MGVIGRYIVVRLTKDRDHIHRCAATKGDELKLHRRWRNQFTLAYDGIELDSEAASGHRGKVQPRTGFEVECCFIGQRVNLL
jgi:hypothetical protein